ncbi:MAG: tRNA-dihydrouridine synthase, partial [Bdellovibrionales bacterium]|nr:tRNA-dihydrouridine synthase [Bdellovibrionales bacterium]
KAAKNCFVPLTIGGGITKTSQVRDLLNVGADKVCVNTTAHLNPNFISEVAGIYGSQFITISVDSRNVDGQNKAFVKNGTIDTGLSTKDFVKRSVELGAGEIIIHSIDRDGSKLGYDLDLIKEIRKVTSVPLIASGGVGRFQHLVDAVKVGGCNGVAAGNIFQHTELSTIAAKSFMKRAGIPIRIDSSVKYENYQFDLWDRPI